MFLWGCANIVPPSGGPADHTPPQIVKITPADSSLNVKPNKIELYFDKFMELGDWMTEMSISPLVDAPIQVVANLRKVTITLPDTLLLPNTTYTLNLGNTLKDNREGTPYPNFNYTFSTGAYIDSLQLQGYVLNAANNRADTQYLAVLYPAQDFTDSMIYNKKPLYVTRVDAKGFFQFKNLPPTPFRMMVLHDRDKDRKYNPLIDGLAYDEQVYYPKAEIDSVNLFRLYYQDLDSADKVLSEELLKSLDDASFSSKPSIRNTERGIMPKEGYLVNVDTLDLSKGTQDINKPLTIYLKPQFVSQVNENKIILTLDKDGTEIQSLIQIEKNDSLINIMTEWKEDTEYWLRLVKGWATDTTQQELVPGKYNFKTKKNDDYSTLQIKFDSVWVNQHYYIKLVNEGETLVTLPIQDTIVEIKHIIPLRSAFQIFVFHDINHDGQWTSGHFINKTQPEPMYEHHQNLVLKAGWVHEEVFKAKSFELKPFQPLSKDGSKPSMMHEHEEDK